MAKSRSIGGIYASLSLRDGAFKAGLKTSAIALKRFGDASAKYAAGAAVVGVGAVGAGIASAISKASNMEMMESQFEVLTGSAANAQKVITGLRAEAAASPLGLADFTKSAQALIGFGIAQEKVVGTTKMLSEVSMGNAERFDTLSLAFAQTAAAGRLMGQEVLQFVNSGFNPLQQISKRTGESMIQLKKRMEDGLIPFSEVDQAFKDATAAGGMFYQMNEKASATYSGKVAKMKDSWDQLLVTIGTPIIDGLKPTLDSLNSADFSGFASNLAQNVSAGFDLIRSGDLWTTFTLQAEKAFLDIQSSPAMNGWAASFNTIFDGITSSIDDNFNFNETFDKYANAGNEANTQKSADIAKKLDDLAQKSQERADKISGRVKPFVPATASAAATPISPPAAPIAATAATKPTSMDSGVNEYQRRGLSLGGSISPATNKQTTLLESIDKTLKSSSKKGELRL